MNWIVECFQSGTMVVSDTSQPKERYKYGVRQLTPHFYIYGPGGETEGEADRNRFKVCQDIRDYLNGQSPRPAWLDDLHRVSETRAVSVDGTSIDSTGPMVDREPPKCFWVQDQSQEAQDARARLMDLLFNSPIVASEAT